MDELAKRRQIFLSMVILALVSFVQYSYSFGNDFIWDSKKVFLDDPSIRDFKYLPGYFIAGFGDNRPLEGGQISRLEYYRPLIQILHLFEYKLFGTNPIGYNAVNLLLNAFAVVMGFLLVYAVTGHMGVGFLSSLLYAVNPTRVEAVSWAYSDSYILSSLFVLMSLYYFHNKRYAFSLMTFALSLLSKETSVLQPVILILYLYLIKKENSFRGYARVLPFFALLGVYLLARKAAVGPAALSDIDIFTLFNAAAVIFKLCAKIFFFPDAPVTIYHYKTGMFSSLNAEVISSYFVLLGLFALGALLWFKKKDCLFWYLWFFVWSAIILNVGKYGEYYMAEKILYLASLGPCVLIANFALHAPFKKATTISLIAVFIAFHFITTFSRTLYWRDNVTYFEKALEFAPDFYMSHLSLADTYRSKGEYNNALIEYEKTVELQPKLSFAHNSIGNIYYSKSDFTRAVLAWRKAIASDPLNAQPYYNIGIVMEKKGDLETAFQYYKKYLSLTPNPPLGALKKITKLERKLGADK